MIRAQLLIVFAAVACALGGLAVSPRAAAIPSSPNEAAARQARPKPVARFAALLKGRMFRRFNNSEGVQSDSTLHFCSNGRFFFSSVFVVVAPGGGSTERQQSAGRWKVLQARFDAIGDGIGIVRLTPARGKVERIEVIVSSRGSAINRQRAYRVKSTRCR